AALPATALRGAGVVEAGGWLIVALSASGLQLERQLWIMGLADETYRPRHMQQSPTLCFTAFFYI
ncbi:MAG: hypothetical protein ACN6NZ_07295, partial [Burkholderiales bacterium]